MGRWVHDFRARAAAGEAGQGGLSETERAELLRLRRENSDLKLDRAFLRTASLFFALDSWIPSSLATVATVRPVLITSFTASSLYSGVNPRRVRPMMNILSYEVSTERGQGHNRAGGEGHVKVEPVRQACRR